MAAKYPALESVPTGGGLSSPPTARVIAVVTRSSQRSRVRPAVRVPAPQEEERRAVAGRGVLERVNVFRLGSLWALDYFELDFLVLFQ